MIDYIKAILLIIGICILLAAGVVCYLPFVVLIFIGWLIDSGDNE